MKTFFAMHKQTKTVIELTGFVCWEQVQGLSRVGFLMPNGQTANGIGRCTSRADLEKRAAQSGFVLLPN